VVVGLGCGVEGARLGRGDRGLDGNEDADDDDGTGDTAFCAVGGFGETTKEDAGFVIGDVEHAEAGKGDIVRVGGARLT